jgi:hypothetical protein
MTLRFFPVVLLSLILLVTGCGYDRTSGVTYPTGDAASITLSVASADTLTSAGDTKFVTAVVKDANHYIITAPQLSWTSSAPSVATVQPSENGAVVTAVNDGTTLITAASGTAHDTISVTVRRRLTSVDLSAPDSVLVAGASTQLTVIGRDARGNPIADIRDVRFTASNNFNLVVSPGGRVTALFSPIQSFDSFVTATLTRDRVTLSSRKHFEVASAEPSRFDFSALMEPSGVRPDPFNAASGIVYFTLDGTRVRFQMLWSLFEQLPTGAHIHGPDAEGTNGVGDVLVDLMTDNQLDVNGTLSGSFSANDIRSRVGKPPISLDSLVTLMRTGQVYTDMHATFASAGEIRGPLFPRP